MGNVKKDAYWSSLFDMRFAKLLYVLLCPACKGMSSNYWHIDAILNNVQKILKDLNTQLFLFMSSF